MQENNRKINVQIKQFHSSHNIMNCINIIEEAVIVLFSKVACNDENSYINVIY